MSNPDDLMEAILDVVARHRFTFACERDLQDGLAAAFSNASLTVEREAPLEGAGRVDFLVGGSVGVEVKIDGGRAALTRQLFGYASHPRIAALVVVTSRNTLGALPETLAGKPLRVAVANRGAL